MKSSSFSLFSVDTLPDLYQPTTRLALGFLNQKKSAERARMNLWFFNFFFLNELIQRMAAPIAWAKNRLKLFSK